MTQLARDGADDPGRRAVYEALVARIDLIRGDPGAPAARGLVRRVESHGTLVRVSTVYVPEAAETWAVVWTLHESDVGDAVHVRLLERIEQD